MKNTALRQHEISRLVKDKSYLAAEDAQDTQSPVPVCL
jgi:hypothetical protein